MPRTGLIRPSHGPAPLPRPLRPARRRRVTGHVPPGRGLSSMLLPELQRVAQSMGITGVGRMRKSQLIEAIQSRQGGQAAGPARSRTASAALDHSATRGAPAGADAPRHREQETMEPDRPIQPASGEGSQAVTSGRDMRAGSAPGASGGPSQLTFAPAAETARSAAPAGEAPSGGAPVRGGAREATGDGQAAGDGQPAGDGPRERRRAPQQQRAPRRRPARRRGSRDAGASSGSRPGGAAVRPGPGRLPAAVRPPTRAAAVTTTTAAAGATGTGSATATGAVASAPARPSR